MKTLQQDVDLLYKVNSVDIAALEDARQTLEVIKSVDPEIYDEMIDETLRLIGIALNTSCADAIERIAKKLGVQT
jgi:hypothetical protein